MKLRIAGMTEESVVDGPGIRFVVYGQGCLHACPGCHNPETQDLEGGSLVSPEEIAKKIEKNPLLDGVTYSGGEPFLQAEAFAQLAEIVKPWGLNLVIYTGYTFEFLLNKSRKDLSCYKLLKSTDLLIDGPYLQEKRDIKLLYRGSYNQRIINIPRTLSSGALCLWQDTTALPLE
nr:anaerobic ribonucleoside-triphosphate reductase activating protein [Candidatus Contubernalis alkalaceticus]